MFTNDVIRIHNELCAASQSLMWKKQNDYTNGTDEPFRNFELGPSLGVGTVSSGIFIRFLDKVSRLGTFISRGKFEVNESLEDTIIDAINYLVLLKASVILAETHKDPTYAPQEAVQDPIFAHLGSSHKDRHFPHDGCGGSDDSCGSGATRSNLNPAAGKCG